MATFSAGKSPSVLLHEDEITDFFSRVESIASRPSYPSPEDPLLTLLDSDSTGRMRSIIESIPFAGDVRASGDVVHRRIANALDETLLIGAPYGFCMAVIFFTMRELCGMEKGKNPTWVKVNGKRTAFGASFLASTLKRNCQNMLLDLRDEYRGLAEPFSSSFSICSDVRELPLRDESVSRIITSPPYLTRIDYAVSTTPELSIFGNDDLVRFVRHNSMGSTVITSSPKAQQERWGLLCNQLLDAIKAHSTKAAASYYWKNIIQYFMDLDLALDQIKRVLGSDGRGLVVVQSSYFKEVEIPLGEIYVEMARLNGLDAEIAFREEVKGHMAHVNTKSSAYKKNKIYHEDFVQIQKRI